MPSSIPSLAPDFWRASAAILTAPSLVSGTCGASAAVVGALVPSFCCKAEGAGVARRCIKSVVERRVVSIRVRVVCWCWAGVD